MRYNMATTDRPTTRTSLHAYDTTVIIITITIRLIQTHIQ